MLSQEVEKELKAKALKVISLTKGNLGKNKGGALSDSLDFRLVEDRDWGGYLYFVGLEYGNYLDQGVQGANPNELPNKAKWFGKQKAPGSPFKFGSGTGPKGGLRGAIDKWTITKGIPGIRGADGKFLPRKSLVYLMTRSIYLAGLSPTYFFTNAQNTYNNAINKKLANAYFTDVKLKTLDLLDPLKTNTVYTRFTTSRRPRKKFNI